jgi:phenylpropionate dioxygenase-like ring-hydroxylating dioxygenase large terminal subunit
MNLENVKLYIDDRPEQKIFRVHRDVYSDPALFELEMKFIFERTWNFLALESQIAKPNDYITTHIARTPVLVARDAKGRLGAFINACRHKGATVARLSEGNARYHVCPYHGWAYDASGKNVDIKDRAAGCYAAAFDQENHDLLPIAQLASYKGLVFGTLSADAPPLEEFLGDMRFFIDIVMDQGPNGMEFVPGRASYTFRGNWKLQMDNGQDGYHLTSTHVSFMELQGRRRKGEGHVEARQFDWKARSKMRNGMFTFPGGHSVLWLDQVEPEKRPFWPVVDEVRSRIGELRTEWALKARNYQFFPNMQFNDSVTTMLRVFRPVSVDLTEMHTYCLAPVGERADLRAWRLRQFEDFFNPSGMATPDDTVTYEDCQHGFAAAGQEILQGFERGFDAPTRMAGANEVAREIGIQPVESIIGTIEMQQEVAMQAPYREWARLMQAGIAGRKAYEGDWK